MERAVTCANCGYSNAAGTRFCENCGQPLERRCPNCGRPASATARFCGNCGYNLSSVASVPAPNLADLRRSAPAPLQEKVRSAARVLEGERKLVTVLFADVVGSTELAEALDPEDWREVVSGAHRRVSEAVHRFEGHVAQLLGDGVLVFFGAPLAHEDDAERAVRAALAILDATRDYADELRQRGVTTHFRLRVGINTGTVVVGNVGSDLHLEYLAIGDTVNLAARVQSAAEPDTVLITDNTRRLLGALFDLEDRGRVALKGKAEPVQVYQVAGRRKGAIRIRGISGLSSAMVGRERELSTLLQVSADFAKGRGGIVLIIGDAGLGKSRLVAEWRHAVERGPQPVRLWVEGRGLSYTSSLPYYFATELLRGLLGVGTDASEEETRLTLKHSCEVLLADKAGEVYPYLAHLLGLELAEAEASFVKYLEGPALQGRYVGAFRGYLSALAGTGPVVLVADDIQWADPSSVDLGVRMMEVTASLPVVIVLVSRPEPEAAGERLLAAAREVRGVSAVELHLAPLADEDSCRLIGNLLNVASLPDDARQLVLAKAEGNPFFVEEVIRMLIDRGVVERRGEQWVTTREVKDIDIPNTLQGVIMARVDRLPEETKRTLQVASVIGRRFQAAVLETVLRTSDATG